MSPQRRALRKAKRERAAHDRAVQQRYTLKQLAAKVTDHATLYLALAPFSSAERLALVEGLRPFLTFDPYAEPDTGNKCAA
jgi:hypothetical protein